MSALAHGRYRKRIAIGERPDMLIDEQFRKTVAFLFQDRLDPETGNLKKRKRVYFFTASKIVL